MCRYKRTILYCMCHCISTTLEKRWEEERWIPVQVCSRESDCYVRWNVLIFLISLPFSLSSFLVSTCTFLLPLLSFVFNSCALTIIMCHSTCSFHTTRHALVWDREIHSILLYPFIQRQSVFIHFVMYICWCWSFIALSLLSWQFQSAHYICSCISLVFISLFVMIIHIYKLHILNCWNRSHYRGISKLIIKSTTILWHQICDKN